MHVLVSYFGTIVAVDSIQSRFVHAPISRIDDNISPIFLEDRGTFCSLKIQTAGGEYESIGIQSLLYRPLEEQSFRAVYIMDDPGSTPKLALACDNQYMRAVSNGSVDFDSSNPNEWEKFTRISIDVFKDLLYFTKNSWLCVSSKEIISFSDALIFGDTLKSSQGYLAIAVNFPFRDAHYASPADGGKLAMSCLIFKDGWKVDELRVFRPLVVYVIFGNHPSYLAQFEISISSLFEFGAYDGKVLIIGDQIADDLRRHIDPAFWDRLLFSRVVGRDPADFAAARFLIGSLRETAPFQPLLYMDLDTMFDKPVESLLLSVAASDKISAQTEFFNPLLVSASVGADLFAHDPVDGLQSKLGFCSGVLGMPNVWYFGKYLKAARRVMTEYFGQYGRTNLGWHDQPMLNYVFFKLDVFDPEPLSSAVQAPRVAEELDLYSPRGVVHFWWTGNTERRLVVMRQYADGLSQVAKMKESTR